LPRHPETAFTVFWLDLTIIGKTIVFMLDGESRRAHISKTKSTARVMPVQPAE